MSLATESATFASGATAPAEWFERIYASANGEASAIPWADTCPNPLLVGWLNVTAPGLVRPGARVAVVGCGLGDDVGELCSRGYDACGFDVSSTAVEWSRRRFPAAAPSLFVADLLDLPARLRHRFDLVVEVYTLQSLPPSRREEAARGIASLCSLRGTVLAISRGREDSVPLDQVEDAPPWPLTPSELTSLFELAELRPIRPVEDLPDPREAGVRRLRGAFHR
ncbi:MAG: class I SAM-dependent methyltransferase [Phycisphaeraceae bacterium]|nr:class I SAM-dependent methyltransferase [Phycisphaeraceae bacterium]